MEIICDNTVAPAAPFTPQWNPKMKSTKPGKERHGFGMESIRKIIELYHGEYACWEELEDHVLWFTQSIRLNIQKEPGESSPPNDRQ